MIKGELLPASCPLTPTCAMAHTPMHVHAHRESKQTNKQTNENLEINTLPGVDYKHSS